MSRFDVRHGLNEKEAWQVWVEMHGAPGARLVMSIDDAFELAYDLRVCAEEAARALTAAINERYA